MITFFLFIYLNNKLLSFSLYVGYTLYINYIMCLYNIHIANYGTLLESYHTTYTDVTLTVVVLSFSIFPSGYLLLLDHNC